MYATTWMNPKNIMLSEKKASRKGPHIVWLSLYEMPRIGKLEIKLTVA